MRDDLKHPDFRDNCVLPLAKYCTPLKLYLGNNVTANVIKFVETGMNDEQHWLVPTPFSRKISTESDRFLARKAIFP